jgi:hypothetical protein
VIVEGDFRISILYLDGDPATVAAALSPKLRERCGTLPVTPYLAAPFESLIA